MVYLKNQANLLESDAVEFISVKAENTLEENSKELSNSKTCMLRHVFLKTNKEITLAIIPFNEIINFKQLDLSNDYTTSLISHNNSRPPPVGNDDKQALPLDPSDAHRVLIALTVKSYQFVIIETDKADLLIKTPSEALHKLVKHSEYRSFTEAAPSIKPNPNCPASNPPPSHLTMKKNTS